MCEDVTTEILYDIPHPPLSPCTTNSKYTLTPSLPHTLTLSQSHTLTLTHPSQSSSGTNYTNWKGFPLLLLSVVHFAILLSSSPHSSHHGRLKLSLLLCTLCEGSGGRRKGGGREEEGRRKGEGREKGGEKREAEGRRRKEMPEGGGRGSEAEKGGDTGRRNEGSGGRTERRVSTRALHCYIVLHGVTLCYTVLHCVTWCYIVLYCKYLGLTACSSSSVTADARLRLRCGVREYCTEEEGDGNGETLELIFILICTQVPLFTGIGSGNETELGMRLYSPAGLVGGL